MNSKIIVAVVVVVALVAAAGYLLIPGEGGHPDPTPFGQWKQDYVVFYEDGTSSTLEIFHNDKPVQYIEYQLSAQVDMDSQSEGSVTIQLDDYKLEVFEGNDLIGQTEFSGTVTVPIDSDFHIVATQQYFAEDIEEGLAVGNHQIVFQPAGTLILEGEEQPLPSSATADVEVKQESNGPGVEIIFNPIVNWS